MSEHAHGPARFLGLMPITPAGPDLGAAIAFYEGVLGFTTAFSDAGSALVRRDGVEILLHRTEDAYWASQTTLRIKVDDVEAAFAEIKPKIGDLKITEIMEPPWGTREFHLIEPFGVCLHFYQRR